MVGKRRLGERERSIEISAEEREREKFGRECHMFNEEREREREFSETG